MHHGSSDPSEDLRQNQRLVYASLMRFGNETVSLRNRALDHLVINALVGTSIDSALKIGQLQEKLHLGTHAPILRQEVIRECVIRLEVAGAVSYAEVRKKKAYFLTDSGREQANSAIVFSEDLFKPVLSRLLKHTDHLIDTETGTRICTDFLCESFARCGLGIAKDISGDADFPHTSELAAAFDAAVTAHLVSDEARQTLEARCLALFKSKDPEDLRLIFYLTQGYYFAQLLGLDREAFNPAGEGAFVDAVFYFDTNVLLLGLLPADGGAAFSEMMTVASRVGMKLKVTRASINEARRVAADRLNELRRIIEVVPEELAKRSLDDFVVRFFERRKDYPSLTPEEYLSAFDNVTQTIEAWGVEIDDVVEEEMLKGRWSQEAANHIQELTAKYRKGRTKSEAVLRHDIAHIFLTEDQRRNNPKTWFLTRDRTLTSCAEALCHDAMPLCFGLLAFLQSISPFVRSDTEVLSLTKVFAELLSEHVITSDRLFDSKELVLLAEMHSDVLLTPVENLLPAIDYIKHTVLHGRAYRQEDSPVVSLELRKFLASSKDEQRKALELLNSELAREALQEREGASESRRARLEAEAELLVKARQLEDLQEALATSQRDTTELQCKLSRLDELSNEVLELRSERDRSLALARARNAILGMAFGVVAWIFRDPTSIWLAKRIGQYPFGVMLSIVAIVLFSVGPLFALRRGTWRTEWRVTAGSLVVATALWATHM